jgi:hypothetical protein
MTARDTVSFRMRSAYVLMLLTPTLASSAKKTNICAGAQSPSTAPPTHFALSTMPCREQAL